MHFGLDVFNVANNMNADQTVLKGSSHCLQYRLPQNLSTTKVMTGVGYHCKSSFANQLVLITKQEAQVNGMLS